MGGLRVAPAILCVIAHLVFGCERAGPSTPPRPPQVEVAPVEQRDVPLAQEWVATLEGYVNAQVQPRVTGHLLKQNFRQGSFVQKHDVLFEIDPRPFQAALDQAKAQASQSQADVGRGVASCTRRKRRCCNAGRTWSRPRPT
jgi:multidrug efflux pump subunit AcrA (membrane-fusion protein)